MGKQQKQIKWSIQLDFINSNLFYTVLVIFFFSWNFEIIFSISIPNIIKQILGIFINKFRNRFQKNPKLATKCLKIILILIFPYKNYNYYKNIT